MSNSTYFSGFVFKAMLNHEFIHAYHAYIGLPLRMSKKEYNNYTEYCAYKYYLDNGIRDNNIVNRVNSYSPGPPWSPIYPNKLIPLH